MGRSPWVARCHAGSRTGDARPEDVLERLRSLYAEALEYPPELLTDDAALEADLGIDSLKQTALLTRVTDEFGLPAEAARARVWSLNTLGEIAAHVTTHLAAPARTTT